MQQNFLQQNYPVSSKTTVFLPDGGLVDAALLPISSRIYVNNSLNTPISTSTNNLSVKTGLNSSSTTSAQYSSHHRDKLNLIRDSLKPFEQNSDEIFYCDNEPNTSASNNLNYNNNIENLFTEKNELSEKIQNLMVYALSQKGYDKESAYYALKLVNFSSVMDAAKVLLSIKKNLNNAHEENNFQVPSNIQKNHILLHQHSESLKNKQKVCDKKFINNSDVIITEANTNSTPLLSSNSIAALSRYGVMSKPIATTITVGGKNDTTFSPNLESNLKLLNTSKLFVNNYSSLNNNDILFKKNGLNQENITKDLSINLNVNQNLNNSQLPQYYQNEQDFLNKKQDLQKSFLGLGKNEYQIAQNSTIFLPQKNSFNQHTLNDINENNTCFLRQVQTSSGMVIKIEKNSNDCPQFSDTNNIKQRISKLSLMPTVLTPLSVEKITKTSKTTTFSPNLQQNLKKEQNQITENSVESGVIQNIYVDPDESENLKSKIFISPPNYKKYVNQKNNFVENSQSINASDNICIQEQQKQPQRCVSPLPQSVSRRLENGSYEKFIKPCKAAMFRFFMEQHIEKLIQQYRERNQRAIQLTKEMEAAELTKTMKDQMLKLLRQKESKYIRLKRQKMNKNMFDMIRHIGVGAFGKVTLVRKKDTNQIYAMKTLSKEDVIQKQQAAHVKAERDILAEANSNWIVKLFFSFQDSQNLYFIMEYVPGGDMMQLLINKGIFSERLAKFYIAELTCAIEYVHSLGFIHRDIKPDNILIDKNGHIKLTDFGLCTGLRWTHDKRHYVIYDNDVPMLANQHIREDSFSLPPYLANSKEKVKLLEYRNHKKRNQAHSVVGTGNYMAPEVIKKTGHTQLCDWWSVGVILYEMVYGRPPFMSRNENSGETQFMIVNWRQFLDLDNLMGARLSRNCVDIIAKLCCDEELRLGKNGAKEIKAHLWFNGIDFANLRSTQAEYIPRVEHAEDTSNFDTFEVNAEEFFKTRNFSQQPYNPAFFDFTFRHFFASEGGYAKICGASNINSGIGNSSRVQQQRPSLAPLIEQANVKKNDKELKKSIEKNNDIVEKKTDLTNNDLNKKTLINSIPNKKIPAPLAPTNFMKENSQSNVYLVKIKSNKDIINYKLEKSKTKNTLPFYVV